MRRSHFRPLFAFLTLAFLTLAFLLASCGGGDGTDTTISSREAPAAEEEQTQQTPPPETTPERAPDSTVPVETPATPPATTGGGNAYDYDYGQGGGTSGGGATTTTTEGADSQGAAIEAADSDLGQILVGPDGMTLYAFLPDEQSASTCYDSCAATWPPLEGQVSAGEGVDEAMLGTIERDDGTTQATYNGWPLYYYVSDAEPGDVTGQGVGDNWFVVDPAGEVVDG